MSNEIVIDYSEVESDYIDVDELVKNPSQFLILDLKTVINCRKCRKRLTIRKSEKNITLLCGCGCRILYPKNKDGNIVSNWIPKEDYKGLDNGRSEQ